MLLLSSTGRAPRHLSLSGSFRALDRCSSDVLPNGGENGFTSSIDVIKDTVVELRRLRNTLDPRTKSASDALEDLLKGISEMHDKNPTRGSPRFNEIARRIEQAVDDLNGAYAALRANSEVQEELNY